MTDQVNLNYNLRLRHWVSQRRFVSFWRWPLIVVGLILAGWLGYGLIGQPVTIIVNGQPVQVRVHRLTVDAVLQELAVELEPEDIVSPPAGTQLASNQPVTIKLARPVTIEVDGRTLSRLTHQQTAATVLAEAEIVVYARDVVLVNGQPVVLDDLLPTTPAPFSSTPEQAKVASIGLVQRASGKDTALNRPESVQMTVYRAIPVTLSDDGINSTFYTAQPTVGQALQEQGVTIYEGDRVTPAPETELLPGMQIYLQRSVPVSIAVDGRLIGARTLRQTVGQVLAEAGIALMGQDYSRPPLAEPISANQAIEIIRVREIVQIDQEFIPFETRWIPDPDMPLDRQEIRQQGVTGVNKTRTRIRLENGQEVWQGVEDEWLDQEPSDRVVAYGTQIVVRTLETEAGPIEYWRKISMLATPYNAATSGKDAEHPRYGITRSGLPAGYGVVAVDPKVIPLMTELYIPGYGPAVAGDTGGLIHGKRVDLGFDDGQSLPDIYDWRDVYILTPVPPADKIRYVLPDWPQQR